MIYYLKYYNKAIPYYINNELTIDNNFNIVGFNKSHVTYNDTLEANKELLNLMNKVSPVLDEKKYNILITHYQLEHLKLEKKLLETFDLILTGTDHKTIKKKLFNPGKLEDEEQKKDKTLIKTGGVCKGEIGFIKIKHL